jgi:hypothetical protein
MDYLLPPGIKEMSHDVMRNKEYKTSDRLIAIVVYLFLRTCEVIDYWFPIKKRQ